MAVAAEINIKDLSSDIRAAIAELKNSPDIESAGIVTRIGDGIAWIYGLQECGYNEMIEIEGDGKSVPAFALNLQEGEIGAVLMGEDVEVKAGMRAKLTGKVMEIPVGPELIGRVVDPLGQIGRAHV